MAKKFLDQTGVSHLWSKIKSLFISKGVGGIVTATSTDGVTYTATLDGVTALTTGLTITIVPSVVSTSISAKLNLNNLGAKYIRQSTTNNTATGLTPKNAGWMAANKPITIQYDGTQWKTIAARSNASDMNGTLAIANGGTGATTKADAQTNLGLNDAIVGLSVSGKTITYTQADGGTGTITTQDTNTTYTAMTASEATTGTATTARSITAKVLHDKINEMVTAKAPHTGNATSIGGASATKPAVVVTTYQSGANWYRVWSDGWIEQGGVVSCTTGNNNNQQNYSTVTLHKAFADTNYNLAFSANINANGVAIDTFIQVWSKAANQFQTRNVDTGNSNSITFTWYACGKGA